MTTGEILAQAQSSLAAISDTPQLEAERILGAVLAVPESSWLYAHPEQLIADAQRQDIDRLVSRRCAGEPLAYVLGQAEFYGRAFTVTPSVLIPRPETEQLVAKALERIPDDGTSFTVADIGTGSGCIAITLALERPSLSLFATDISKEALDVAERNARRHHVANRIQFVHGDMLAPFDFTQGKPPFDLIVSNPPYVPTAELARAAEDPTTIGLTFEPRLALDGGSNGLNFVNQIKNSGVSAAVESVRGEIKLFG